MGGLLDWAGSIAAITAVVALFWNIAAFYADSRSRDVSSCIDLLERFREAERRLNCAASDQAARIFAVREHANFIEGVARLVNSRRIKGQTGELCKEQLILHLAAMTAHDDVRKLLQQAVTSERTYSEVRTFYRAHKSDIESQAQMMKLLGED